MLNLNYRMWNNGDLKNRDVSCNYFLHISAHIVCTTIYVFHAQCVRLEIQNFKLRSCYSSSQTHPLLSSYSFSSYPLSFFPSFRRSTRRYGPQRRGGPHRKDGAYGRDRYKTKEIKFNPNCMFIYLCVFFLFLSLLH